MFSRVRLADKGINWLGLTFAAFYDALSAIGDFPPVMTVKASSDHLAEKNMDRMDREFRVEASAPDFVDPFEGV